MRLMKRKRRETMDHYHPRKFNHLLFQFNQTFAKDPFILWVLFDADHIKRILGQSASLVRYDPKSIATLLEMLNSKEENFGSKIARCIKNPTSPEANALIKLVTKHMVMAGKKTPYSAMMRHETKSLLINISKYFGPFSTFVTSSPNHEMLPLAFRSNQPSINNTHFPATVHLENVNDQDSNHDFDYKPETKLHDALLNSKTNPILKVHVDGVEKSSIPISPNDLYKSAVENPIGTVSAFDLMQKSVLKYVLGCPIFHFRHQTIPLDARIKGIHGINTIAEGLNEAQARGWLHMHIPTRSGITADVLDHIAECKALVAIVSKIIDSRFTSELDRHVHLDTLKRTALEEQKNSSSFINCLPYIPKSIKIRKEIEQKKKLKLHFEQIFWLIQIKTFYGA